MKKYLRLDAQGNVISLLEVSEPITNIDSSFFEVAEDFVLDRTKKYKVVQEQLHTEIDTIAIQKEKIKIFEKEITNFLNSKAQEKGYDSILSACTYAVARGRFQQEGIKFAEWRTDVWDYYYTESEKIEQGLRAEPTIEEFINELPNFPLSHI